MSSVYTFDDHVLPSGTLKLVLTNDVGSATVSVTGSRILSIAEVTEEVEENGIGGVLRIPDFEVEIDDDDGVLKDTILNRSAVTKCDASIVLNVGGTDEGVMYGDVDLTTIEYITHFDDETGGEKHSVKFVIFSLLKRLETVTLTTLKVAVDTFKVSRDVHTALESIHRDYGFNGIQEALGGSSTSIVMPGNALQLDGFNAEAHLTNLGDYSNFLVVDDFRLFVPVGATVRGFKFKFHYFTTDAPFEVGVKVHSAKLVKGGVSAGSAITAPAGNLDSPGIIANNTFEVGGFTDLGGLTFTPTEANDAGTGIAISFERTSALVVGDVIINIDSVECTVYYESGATDDRYVVKELEIIRALQEAISTNTDSVTHSVSQGFTHEDDANPDTNETYDNLYHIWRYSGAFADAFDRLWATATTGSFSQLRSAIDVLKAIAGMRVAYPILVYAPGTGKVHFKIKQRGSGTVYTGADLGILKSSSLKTFVGYDAFKISMLVNAIASYSPSSISEDEFNILAQKFAFDSYFGVTQSEVYISAINYVDISHYMWVPDGTLASTVSNVNRIDDGADQYTTFASFLLAKFNQFWGNNQMYTRVYQGTGIGGSSPVEILDQVTIDSVDFTIISIKRDLIANEMTLKLVEF